MVDVLLSSDSIDVIGGSSKASVDLTIGSKGERGNFVLVGNGKPTDGSTMISETPKAYDMFINLAPDDNEYLYLYQYLSTDGVYGWKKLLRLIPNTYIDIFGDNTSEGEFVSGILEYNLPIINVIPLATVGIYQSTNFNIQYTIVGDNPTASSLEVGAITADTTGTKTGTVGTLYLPIKVRAWELDPALGGFQTLSGQVPVHFIVTVV